MPARKKSAKKPALSPSSRSRLKPEPQPGPMPITPVFSPASADHQPVLHMSSGINELAQAIAGFQGTVRVVSHDREGYGYTYTTLAALLEDIAEPLASHDLAVSQFPLSSGEDSVGVMTILMHSSGQYVASSFVIPIPEPVKGRESGKYVLNKTQRAGVALTYARRYAISAVLGIATEADTDADAS